MTMHVYSATKISEIEKFVNKEGIEKENIISIIQASDKDYILTYFA